MRYNCSSKSFQRLTEEKIKCENCGHTQLLGNEDKMLCSHCNHYIFKNKKLEFAYRLKEQVLKH